MIGIIAMMLLSVSCTDFLTVKPKTFLSPDNYFNTASEMQEAANGLYSAVGSSLFSGLVASITRDG